jgi:hypothetical protein
LLKIARPKLDRSFKDEYMFPVLQFHLLMSRQVTGKETGNCDLRASISETIGPAAVVAPRNGAQLVRGLVVVRVIEPQLVDDVGLNHVLDILAGYGLESICQQLVAQVGIPRSLGRTPGGWHTIYALEQLG